MNRARKPLALTLLLASSLLSGCGAVAVGAAGGAAAGGVETKQAMDDPQRNYSAGTYTATVLSNTAYLPAKAIFAGAGALTSGVAYLVTLGDSDVSGSIWDASVDGTYVITPEHIEGNREIRFVG